MIQRKSLIMADVISIFPIRKLTLKKGEEKNHRDNKWSLEDQCTSSTLPSAFQASGFGMLSEMEIFEIWIRNPEQEGVKGCFVNELKQINLSRFPVVTQQHAVAKVPCWRGNPSSASNKTQGPLVLNILFAFK